MKRAFDDNSLGSFRFKLWLGNVHHYYVRPKNESCTEKKGTLGLFPPTIWTASKSSEGHRVFNIRKNSLSLAFQLMSIDLLGKYLLMATRDPANA